MPDASLVRRARDCHRRSLTLADQAAQARHDRDAAIRRLYSAGGLSYSRIAALIGDGCGPELVAKIVQGRSGTPA